MTPTQFASDYIPRWEGGMSRDTNDAGNWSTGTKGTGVLLGSNHGITGRTLAAFRNVNVATLTMKDIENLSLDEAVKIAIKLFYTDVGLDRIVWNHVTASIMDFGWTAGPTRAIKLLQNLLDLGQDGKIDVGGATVKAYANETMVKGEAFMAGAWWAMREDYYETLVANRPSDGIYLNGWDNRSDYFTPGHKEGWWKRFG